MCGERNNKIILRVFVLAVLGAILNFQRQGFAQPARTSNARDFSFKHLTIDDGLSQGMVLAIYQDRQGFLWFGTKDGLNRYDGYRFTVFRNDPFDSTSLSNNFIQTILEDRRGRLWIGTAEGLNCFDPETEKFRRFLHDAGQPYSLSGNSIYAICEAPAPENEAKGISVLWIGTLDGGLNKLVLRETPSGEERGAKSERREAKGDGQRAPFAFRPSPFTLHPSLDHYFIKYLHHPADPRSLSSNRVWGLLVDRAGVLWVGTDRGLCRLNPPHSLSPADDQQVNFTRYTRNEKEKSSLLDNYCSSLEETRDGSIWIGTRKGLSRMAPANPDSLYQGFKGRSGQGTFENYSYAITPALPQTENFIVDICEDGRGALWLATYLGLFIFDPKEAGYQWVRHDAGDPASLSYDGVRAVYRDRSGAMWIGTMGFGLSRWDQQAKQFHAYTSEELDPSLDTKLSISALLEDRRGIMWIFTGNDWYQLNRQTGSVAHRPLEFVSLETNALHEDSDLPLKPLKEGRSFLWITNSAGVFRYDPRLGRIEKFFPQPGEPKFRLHAIYEDNHGDIWFGSFSNLSPNAATSPAQRHALYRWNRQTEKVTAYPLRIPETIKGEWLMIVRIIQEQSGGFWLGTNQGLLRFHPWPYSPKGRPQRGALKIFRNEPSPALPLKPSKERRGASLTNNEVKTLMADPRQPERFLWVGTNGGGLNRFDIAAESFSHYTEEHGLPNNVVYGLLSDDAGNLWMSTNKGLSKAMLTPDTREIVKFINYDVGDGLQSNEFNTNAYFKNSAARGGEMFFGGIKGFNVFHPDSIRENSQVPPVVFTDLQINYQSINPGQPGSPLQKTINTTETITLAPKDNVVTFEFAALDYTAPEKNLYAYKLENFEENWSRPSHSRRATYTNLEPGEYVFRVRGSNKDGVWNEIGAALKLIVMPPWWKTWWFRTGSVLAILGLIISGHRFRMANIEARNRELKKEIAERQQAEAALREKLRFEKFTAELSAKFVNLPAGEFDQYIERGLKSMVEFLGVDRSTFVELSPDRAEAYVTHSYAVDGVKPVPKVNVAALMPWAFAKVRRGEILRFSSLAELPEEAAIDRKNFAKFGQKSNITIPLSVSGASDFLLAVGATRAERAWPDELIPRLRLIGEIFANASARKRAEEQLRQAFAEIQALQERLQKENIYLREEIKLQHHYDEMIGQSEALKYVLYKVEQVAPANTAVLLLGETGAGKELIARAIHHLSPRKDRAMVKVNCAALPAALVESELFGREKGAYTGAMTKQAGRFEAADGSTIFLDEIGELSPELQAKLLRVLQEGEFERLGSPKTIKVDVRVIAATNRDLAEAVREKKFRADLYYRLNVFPLAVPPLRERTEDIPLLVWAFLDEFGERMGKKIATVSKKTMEALQRYPWPGNVRELRNVIEHAVIISAGEALQVQLPEAPAAISAKVLTLEEAERQHILQALETTNWRIKGPNGAAELLGLKPSTLYSRMEKLGIPLRGDKLS